MLRYPLQVPSQLPLLLLNHSCSKYFFALYILNQAVPAQPYACGEASNPQHEVQPTLTQARGALAPAARGAAGVGSSLALGSSLAFCCALALCRDEGGLGSAREDW
jgi:hypothetical protein